VAIGLLTLDLRFPGVLSLKDKRSVLRPLLADLRRSWNVSASETGDRDLWQRATVEVATVNSAGAEAHATLEAVARHVGAGHAAELVDYSIQLL
jgi:hypothetical protein